MKHFVLTMVMAARNLLRNRRRTLSTLLAIAVGLVGLTFLDGYISYSIRGLREVVIHSGTGHIQAALSPGYFDEGDDDPIPFMLPEAKRLEAELRSLPEVADVVPTVSFIAVIAAKGRTSTAQVSALPIAQAKADLDELAISPRDGTSSRARRAGSSSGAASPGSSASLRAIGSRSSQ